MSTLELFSRGGGGTLVLFVVRRRAIFRGTFFKPLRNYGSHFHNFLTFHGIMGVFFRGFFIISGIMAQYSICGIMALESTINSQNFGYRFFGQNGTSPSRNTLSYPPPPSLFFKMVYLASVNGV